MDNTEAFLLNIETLNIIAEGLRFEYHTGTIVSERHLQALFYNLIRLPFAEKGITVLIEPKISTQNDCSINGLIPDMLLVKDQEICGVIEIKYVPHAFPQFEKDLATFEAFKSQKNKPEQLFLIVNPADGNWNEEITFSISDQLDIYYLVMARYDSAIFTDTNNIVSERLKHIDTYKFQPIFILIHPEQNPEEFQIILDRIEK